ncbi:E3 ubiquitin-protein ligase MYLIP [Nilaparvata lugens]|uniref:E3 ubiquitin-protein ligase MYLIP n=1 Tax=Nilaparvata lugens TaxID=108931 RepID=UPI00193E9A3F|nr:E3 ubiquitin-protein ligase MYLIP [Nilaparvata lugens]
MWCLVSQPNSVIIEVEVTQKAKGQECLEKVCSCLGINNESDYFGLKYHSVKGQECWLNLRNPIERQVGGVAPFRFALRVKFWVPPHLVLQDTTRHLFYLHAKMDIAEGRLKLDSRDTALKLAALISQAELGDFEPVCPPVHFYEQWCQYLLGETLIDNSTIEKVAEMHDNVKGMKTLAAEYWLLKEISTNECYGEEIFTCKGTALGIGPHGITIYEPQKQTIAYTAIKSAASHRRVFQLSYEQGGETCAMLELKFDSSLAASAVYRALTEKHAFYSCETVRGAVTSQFIRDLKGTIVSIFNESTPLGKKYVFDIRRTCREVHDNARRALYQDASTSQPPQPLSPTLTLAANKQHPAKQQQNSATEKLARLLDALTCR